MCAITAGQSWRRWLETALVRDGQQTIDFYAALEQSSESVVERRGRKARHAHLTRYDSSDSSLGTDSIKQERSAPPVGCAKQKSGGGGH